MVLCLVGATEGLDQRCACGKVQAQKVPDEVLLAGGRLQDEAGDAAAEAILR